jgi:hypothetical protein
MDQRGQLLRAAVGFAGCSMPSYNRALHALRTWLDSWTGIGHVAVGMHRQAPIYGNLLHHTAEMYLKAALVGALTPKQMKDKYGHDLEKLWARFKAKVADVALDRFDATIHALHEFEDLRYPDNIKYGSILMAITWSPSDAVVTYAGTRPGHQYEVFISEVDALVIEVLDRMSLNPKLVLGGRSGREALQYQNPHAARCGLDPSEPDAVDA